MPSTTRFRLPGPLAIGLALAVTVVAVVVVVREVDGAALLRATRSLTSAPGPVVAAVTGYAVAFAVRGWAWHRVVPAVPVGHAIAAVHVALLGNHVLPLRLGEPLRVTSVVRRAGVDVPVAVASTVALRGADLAALAALAAVLGAGVATQVSGLGALLLVVVATTLAAGGGGWLRHLARQGRARVRVPGPGVVTLVVGAWVLESGIVWVAARGAGVTLTLPEAVLVTTVTVAAQVAAVAPGGFGTYEAAGTAVLVTLGVPAATGLAIALTAHAIKTGYALLAGAVAVVAPPPSLLGRLRLPGSRPRRPAAGVADGPVVLFLPAHDEEDSVGSVVSRIPRRVAGRDVVPLVIDDGSRDATAARAAAAGAEVVSVVPNRGLGAAVRRGLREGVDRGAAVVVFCDADGEYAPEELARLVTPVLAGEADYVVGSRFSGDIRRMLPHRRVGNLVLTAWTRWVARAPITDGQSGYRALSREAAAAVHIEHDFNYAQVLTLDLLARGFRYREVPIGYAFREQGRSFVRLGRYLRRVVPAVWRVVNRPACSVLDDVLCETRTCTRPGRGVHTPVLGQRVDRGPRHRQCVMGVVVHEQALAAEGEQPRPGVQPVGHHPDPVREPSVVDGVGRGEVDGDDVDDAGGREPGGRQDRTDEAEQLAIGRPPDPVAQRARQLRAQDGPVRWVAVVVAARVPVAVVLRFGEPRERGPGFGQVVRVEP